VGNLRGRLRAVKVIARQTARVAARDGADLDRAMAKELKAIKPTLKKLQARLAKTRQAEGTLKGSKGSAQQRRAKTPQKPPGKVSRGKVPEDYDDLLATLNEL